MASGSGSPTTVVAGGGIAGMSTAVRLARAGHSVVLLERRRQLGGRAHGFTDPRTGDRVDNGQHVVTTGYGAFLDFLSIVGSRDLLVFEQDRTTLFRDPMHGEIALRMPRLPGRLAPLASLVAMLGLRNVSRRDRLGVLRALPAFVRLAARGARADRELDATTAGAFLDRIGVGPSLRRA